MDSLPPHQTPLNQHSLASLELWLTGLGGQRIEEDPCRWLLFMQDWSVEINLEKDSLSVVWEKKGKKKPCSFSYGLPRQDIEMAILEGP